MRARNAAWMDEYAVSDESYAWTYEPAQMVFDRESGPEDGQVIADICVVGRVSETDGMFEWAWAVDDVPEAAKEGLAKVRSFGEENQLSLLTEGCHPGGLTQGKECACITGRILDAEGFFIEPGREYTLLFALHNFRSA
ncbi:MAG: hypothetical protein JKY37_33090 [Nannocystaceae bacterium]|nr:hypothetical protein [Nannocystaceae bacterium]